MFKKSKGPRVSKNSILYDPEVNNSAFNLKARFKKAGFKKAGFKKAQKWILITIILAGLGGLGYSFLSHYIDELETKVEIEKTVHVKNTGAMKTFVNEIKELETQLEDIKWEKDIAAIEAGDIIYEMKLLYDNQIYMIECEKNDIKEEMIALEQEVAKEEQARYEEEIKGPIIPVIEGVTYETFIENDISDNGGNNDNNNYSGNVNSESSGLQMKSSLGIDFGQVEWYGSIADSYIDKRNGQEWCYLSLSGYDQDNMIIRYLMNPPQDYINENSSGLVEIIYVYEAEGHMNYMLHLTGEEELLVCLDRSIIHIDMNSGDYLYTQVYGNRSAVGFANNGASLYVDEEYVMYYEYEGSKRAIFYGYESQEVADYYGDDLLMQATSIKVSPGGEYFTYYINYPNWRSEEHTSELQSRL